MSLEVPEKENRLHRSVSSIENHHHYYFQTRNVEQERRQIADDAMLAHVLQEEESRLSAISAAQRSYSSSSVYGTRQLSSSLNSELSLRPLVIAPPLPPPIIIERRVAPPPPPPPPTTIVIEDSSRSSNYFSGFSGGLLTQSTSIPLITFDVTKRFLLTKKLWRMGGEFYIKDEAGEEIFRVKGKLMSVGARLKIVDLRGVELAYIYQRLALRKPYYEVWKWDTLFMSLKGKKGHELGADYFADGSRFSFIGRFKENDYEMRRGTGMLSHQVARISPFNTDSYIVEIAAKEDVIVVLSAAIIIERICHDW